MWMQNTMVAKSQTVTTIDTKLTAKKPVTIEIRGKNAVVVIEHGSRFWFPKGTFRFDAEVTPGKHEVVTVESLKLRERSTYRHRLTHQQRDNKFVGLSDLHRRESVVVKLDDARKSEFDRRLSDLLNEFIYAEISDKENVISDEPDPELVNAGFKLTDSATLKEMVLAASKWLSSESVGELAQMSPTNLRKEPNKWKREGKVFTLKAGNADVYPDYAFDDEGRPLPAMKTVLEIFKNKRSNLQIAAWFASVNGWLDGAAPMNLIAAEPEKVIEAAKSEVEPIDHG